MSVYIKEEQIQSENNGKTEEYSKQDFEVEIKVESLEEDVESENVENSLYTDHEIKDGLVIGPVVLQTVEITDQVQSTETLTKTPDPKSCYLCYEQFQNYTDFKNHMLAHSRNKKYCCNTCKKYYLDKISLQKHMKKHTDADLCDICKLNFPSKLILNKHLSIHTTEMYSCDLCKKNYDCKTYWTIHLRKHLGEKIYSCKFCTKQFEAPSGLACHERTHTGEKPFSCEHCSASFSRISKLHRHMRQHTGIKSQKCGYCEKKFMRPIDLKRHVNTHLNCD